MVDERKAAVVALAGHVVICTAAATVLHAVAAHLQGDDIVGAVLFGPDVDVVLAFAVATAILAVAVFPGFRAIFRLFQQTHRAAFAFGGGVVATAALRLLGGMKEALAFAIAGAIAGNLYRECETWALARRRMTETA
jgi:hypothetical protein